MFDDIDAFYIINVVFESDQPKMHPTDLDPLMMLILDDSQVIFIVIYKEQAINP